MAVRIRLARVGTIGKPYYRIVVADRESPRNGRALEVIGHYNPRQGIHEGDLKTERLRYWLSCGAEPTGIVRQLVKKSKIIQKAA